MRLETLERRDTPSWLSESWVGQAWEGATYYGDAALEGIAEGGGNLIQGGQHSTLEFIHSVSDFVVVSVRGRDVAYSDLDSSLFKGAWDNGTQSSEQQAAFDNQVVFAIETFGVGPLFVSSNKAIESGDWSQFSKDAGGFGTMVAMPAIIHAVRVRTGSIELDVGEATEAAETAGSATGEVAAGVGTAAGEIAVTAGQLVGEVAPAVGETAGNAAGIVGEAGAVAGGATGEVLAGAGRAGSTIGEGATGAGATVGEVGGTRVVVPSEPITPIIEPARPTSGSVSAPTAEVPPLATEPVQPKTVSLPTRGMGGRVLTAAEQVEFDSFAQRAKGIGTR